jgi:transcription antitermination factor NusG
LPALLPTVKLTRQWADRRRAVEFPLFPGYVFARFALTELHEVLSVPGIATVVRFGARPVPIREDEIENIKRVAAGFTAIGTRPDPLPFAEGQAVRVIDGPFRGVRGIVVRIRGRHRVLAGLSDIDLAVSIDVDEVVLESI